MIYHDPEIQTASIVDNTPVDMTLGTAAEVSAYLEPVPRTNNLPISLPGRAQVGSLLPSFRDDYYYHIHVVPQEIDFGYLAGESAETYLVWNAFFVAKSGDYTSDDEVNVTFTDENGVAVSSPTTFALGGLYARTFTVTAPYDGDTSFEITHNWNFGADADVDVSIIGTRAVLFPWRPEGEVKETLEWLTEIITANDGTEQRICLRQIPRVQYDWAIQIANVQEFSRLDAMLHSHQKLVMAVPAWAELTRLSGASLAADATEILFDTSSAGYVADGLAVVWKSVTDCEIVSIDSVAADRLTLKSGLGDSYSGNVFIAPAQTCYVVGSASRTDYSTSLQVTEIRWIVKTPVAVTGYTPSRTHAGRPVLVDGYCGLDDTQSEQSDAVMSGLDFGTGALNLWSDATYNRVTRTYRFYQDTPAAAWTMRQLLHSLYGRQLTVHVPTWKADMTLNATIGDSDTSFQVAQYGLADAYGVNTLRNTIMIRRTDGTIYTRTVTGITEGVGYDVVSISAALGLAMTVAECDLICWLDRYRLAEDQAVFEWQRAGVSTCDLPLTMVTA